MPTMAAIQMAQEDHQLSPRILHTITSLGVGGAQIMLQRYLKGIGDAPFSSEVLSLLPHDALTPGIAEFSSRAPNTLAMRNGTFRAADAWRLRSLVGRIQPDLLHGWMYHGNIAATLGSLLGLRFVPVIWSIHHTIADLGAEKELTRRIIRVSASLSKFTGAISYCSKVAADQHEKEGFDPRRRRVVPNGTDCSLFRPGSDRRGMLRNLIDIPENRKIIGHFARYHPMKDQELLVRAVHRLVAAGHDVQLVVIGEGHDRGPIRQLARSLGMDERLTTFGLRQDVAELIAGIDVYALSSAWGEAFPLAVGEAMASEIPAVVTDVGDAGWLVGTTGLVVPPRNTEAFSAGLAAILDLSEEARRALGRSARQRILQHFSLEQYVKAHLDIYDDVLHLRRTVPAPTLAL